MFVLATLPVGGLIVAPVKSVSVVPETGNVWTIYKCTNAQITIKTATARIENEMPTHMV